MRIKPLDFKEYTINDAVYHCAKFAFGEYDIHYNKGVWYAYCNSERINVGPHIPLQSMKDICNAHFQRQIKSCMIEYKIFDVFGNDISPESLLSFEMAEKICGEHFKDLLRRCVGGVKVEPCNECSDRSWLVAENRDIRRDIYGWK